MKVYIIMTACFHENDKIIGVFASLDAAKNHPLIDAIEDWKDDGWYVSNRKECIAQRAVCEDSYPIEDYLVLEFEVQQ